MGKAEIKSSINRKKEEKSDYERQKRQVEDKLARLRSARDGINAYKDQIGDLGQAVRGKEDQKDTWTGVQYTSYTSYVSGDFRGSYDQYYARVDAILDSIYDEITRLENESSDIGGAIGWLGRSINSLWNEIEKLAN